jgi:hypothetical protein
LEKRREVRVVRRACPSKFWAQTCGFRYDWLSFLQVGEEHIQASDSLSSALSPENAPLRRDPSICKRICIVDGKHPENFSLLLYNPRMIDDDEPFLQSGEM